MRGLRTGTGSPRGWGFSRARAGGSAVLAGRLRSGGLRETGGRARQSGRVGGGTSEGAARTPRGGGLRGDRREGASVRRSEGDRREGASVGRGLGSRPAERARPVRQSECRPAVLSADRREEGRQSRGLGVQTGSLGWNTGGTISPRSGERSGERRWSRGSRGCPSEFRVLTRCPATHPPCRAANLNIITSADSSSSRVGGTVLGAALPSARGGAIRARRTAASPVRSTPIPSTARRPPGALGCSRGSLRRVGGYFGHGYSNASTLASPSFAIFASTTASTRFLRASLCARTWLESRPTSRRLVAHRRYAFLTEAT